MGKIINILKNCLILHFAYKSSKTIPFYTSWFIKAFIKNFRSTSAKFASKWSTKPARSHYSTCKPNISAVFLSQVGWKLFHWIQDLISWNTEFLLLSKFCKKKKKNTMEVSKEIKIKSWNLGAPWHKMKEILREVYYLKPHEEVIFVARNQKMWRYTLKIQIIRYLFSRSSI